MICERRKLIRLIAKEMHTTISEADDFLQAYDSVVCDLIAQGINVNHKGMVTYEIAERPAHDKRMPDGSIVKVEAKKKVRAISRSYLDTAVSEYEESLNRNK